VECSEEAHLNNNNLVNSDKLPHLDSNSLHLVVNNNNLALVVNSSSRHLVLGRFNSNSSQACSGLNQWVVNKLQFSELNQPLVDNSLEEVSSQQAISLEPHLNPVGLVKALDLVLQVKELVLL